jgi:hypothetical protein
VGRLANLSATAAGVKKESFAGSAGKPGEGSLDHHSAPNVQTIRIAFTISSRPFPSQARAIAVSPRMATHRERRGDGGKTGQSVNKRRLWKGSLYREMKMHLLT